ncbi:branched-chain amino acid ABC transporter permease [Plantactinospora sp. KLBMP9567]|uniref:branched-chain amino acid ABC transporter permease n=1 Tax=Plantactinospora sp. KLBMP9567 TaxID=3085900 RepID=UPI0029817DF8|nr:branched-chain amino acid ABC transporter permease [Plantactinospora sp. KLBMP9567]MDW5328393.1 branched-chain amino acid ABC transporter permease [Plantactinospora sp. KLBMP9567]
MTELLYFTIIGLCIGCGYALVALGISTLFNGTGVLNFAQGDIVMLAALFVAVRTTAGGGYLSGFLEAVAVVLVASVLLGLLFVRPAIARRRDIDLIIVGTIGVSTVLANLANNVLGSETYRLASPVTAQAVKLESFSISFDYFAILLAAGLLMAAFFVFYRKTDVGLQMRAMSADVDAARLSGVQIARLTVVGWVFAGIVGVFAGVLLGTVLLVSASMGVALTISGFAAAMIGGLRHPYGAVLGGVIIGLAENYAAGYLNTAARQAIAPLIIMAVLLVLPQGILAGRGAKARVV